MRALRALAVAAAVVAALTLGTWLAGGLITDSFFGSIALTAVWFAVALVAVVLLARRRRDLAVPAIGAYLVAAAAIGGWLGWSTLHDRVVHEDVVRVGDPVVADSRHREPHRGAVLLARGRFTDAEHPTVGTASVLSVGGGGRMLTLTGFSTSAGPDLRVRVVPGPSDRGDAAGAIDLGALKGNRGDQQYALPAGSGRAGDTVVVWCRAFSATFGSARLSDRREAAVDRPQRAGDV